MIRNPSAFFIDECAGSKRIFYTEFLPPASPAELCANPYTPLTHLIEGTWNLFPETARKLLRNRLYTLYPRTPLCDGMIKVAAKRANQISLTEFQRLLEPLQECEWILVEPTSEFEISEPVPGRNVDAQLFDSAGVLVASAHNGNYENRTLHAELILVRKFILEHRQLIPARSKLMVSLKPCAMCAAQIFTFAEDISQLEITYLKDDPGPMAQNTVLIKGSQLWRNANSPATKINKICSSIDLQK